MSTPATAVAVVEVAGRHRIEIVYPEAATAESDPVADAYRQGFAGSLSPLVDVAEAALAPGDRVLDLGAHLGGFALTAAAMGCEVIAVEASPELAACLAQSAERSGRGSLKVVHAAVSDIRGSIEFSALGPWGHVATPLTIHPSRAVPAQRVDDLLQQHGWDRVRFIKLDVEGSELRALAGMQTLLQRADAPIVFFESNRHTLSLYGQDEDALLRVFRRAGYDLYRVPEPGRLEPVGESAPQGEVCCDYLAMKAPIPAGLLSWLPPAAAISMPAPTQLIDWLGRPDATPALPGLDPLRHALTVYRDWAVYLATLAHRPLPTAIVIDMEPPAETGPFLAWIARRGVLLGATAALLRALPAAPAWLTQLRLLIVDADAIRIAGLPPGARIDCLGAGALPHVPDGCRVEIAPDLDAALQQQRLRIRAEQALWASEPVAAPVAGSPLPAPAPVATPIAEVTPVTVSTPPGPPPIQAVIDRRELWLRRALRLARLPLIGPLFSWGWAVFDLVGTRRKVLRFEERFAATIEAQAMTDRNVRDLGASLARVERTQGEFVRNIEGIWRRLDSLEASAADSAARFADLQAETAALRNTLQVETSSTRLALQAEIGSVRLQVEGLAERWKRDFLAPGAELPFALQRELPDQLERARAALGGEQAPVAAELGDFEVSQMWLGELSGPAKRAILTRQYEAYWPWLEPVDGPVLDVGCGAGDWLSFLAARGKTTVGIDNNRHEIERCRAAGLDAHAADAFDWLAAHPGQYGAITLFQVIEHIPRARLQQFLGLLAGALRPGGLLLLETVNPAHPLALSVFYNDPTHQRPLPVEYLGFVCQSAGLRPEATLYNYPVSVAVTGADMQAMHYLNYTLVLRRP